MHVVPPGRKSGVRRLPRARKGRVERSIAGRAARSATAPTIPVSAPCGTRATVRSSSLIASRLLAAGFRALCQFPLEDGDRHRVDHRRQPEILERDGRAVVAGAVRARCIDPLEARSGRGAACGVNVVRAASPKCRAASVHPPPCNRIASSMSGGFTGLCGLKIVRCRPLCLICERVSRERTLIGGCEIIPPPRPSDRNAFLTRMLGGRGVDEHAAAHSSAAARPRIAAGAASLSLRFGRPKLQGETCLRRTRRS